MKTLTTTSLAIGLGLLGALSAPAATTLLFDDFEDGNIATGGFGTVNSGFQLVNNDSGGTGTVSETGGNMVTSSSPLNSGSDNSGGVSINSFDASSAGSPGIDLVVTWTISSLSSFSTTSNGDRVLLGLSGSQLYRGGDPEDHISLDFRGNGDVILRADAGSNTTIASISDRDDIIDGFTVTGTFNVLGWTYSFGGITSIDNAISQNTDPRAS